MSQEPRQVLDQGREHESNGQFYYVGSDQKRLCIEGILNISLCIGRVLRCENKRCLQANSGGKGIFRRGDAISLKAENKVLTLTFKALHELTTLPSGFIPYFSHPPSRTLLRPHSSIIAIQKYQPHSQLGAFAPWTLTVFSPDTHVAISHYY